MTQRRSATLRPDPRTDELSRESIMCRSMGHAWNPVPQGRARRDELFKLGETEYVLQCSRCGAAKTQLIDLSTGNVEHTSTKYPDGYLLVTHGQGHLYRRDCRLAMIGALNML